MEKERKLEIGSGNNPTDGYIHLDINPKAPHVEMVGDIMTIIAPHDFPENYPDLDFLKPGVHEELGLYEEIIAKHFIEHIHWLYQPILIKFFFNILVEGGILEIETPDFEWIVKTYINGRGNWFRRWISNKRMKKDIKSISYFPADHPDIYRQTLPNLSRWTAFRIFSGGSYDKESGIRDYHLGLYDKERLSFELVQVGFQASVRRDFQSGVLKVFAKKASTKEAVIKDHYVGTEEKL